MRYFQAPSPETEELVKLNFRRRSPSSPHPKYENEGDEKNENPPPRNRRDFLLKRTAFARKKSDEVVDQSQCPAARNSIEFVNFSWLILQFPAWQIVSMVSEQVQCVEMVQNGLCGESKTKKDNFWKDPPSETGQESQQGKRSNKK
jgi:hypothetical protein